MTIGTASETSREAPDAPVLLRSDRDHIATLILNRPAARNALSTSLMAAMQAEIDRIAEDPEMRVVIVGANGPVYCAGHDLREMRVHSHRKAHEALFAQCSALMLSLMRLPKPVIARVQGTATAAGCQLVATCDLAVAAETAKFATPGVDIGLFCSTPMVAISRNLPRKRMMEMLLTGMPIDAATAASWGLVNRVVAPNALDTETRALAAGLADKSALTLATGKTAFYRQLEQPIVDAYAQASRAMTANMLAEDAREGIDSFLEKRLPSWQHR